MPTMKTTLVDPATEVVNLIPRIWSRPDLDRVARTERVTRFEVSRGRYRIPHLFGRRRDYSLRCDRPFQARVHVTATISKQCTSAIPSARTIDTTTDAYSKSLIRLATQRPGIDDSTRAAKIRGEMPLLSQVLEWIVKPSYRCAWLCTRSECGSRESSRWQF